MSQYDKAMCHSQDSPETQVDLTSSERNPGTEISYKRMSYTFTNSFDGIFSGSKA